MSCVGFVVSCLVVSPLISHQEGRPTVLSCLFDAMCAAVRCIPHSTALYCTALYYTAFYSTLLYLLIGSLTRIALCRASSAIGLELARLLYMDGFSLILISRYNPVLSSSVLYNTVLYCLVLYSTVVMLFSVVLFSVVLYFILLYFAILHCLPSTV